MPLLQGFAFAILIIAGSAALLPQSRSAALEPADLLVRVVLMAVGIIGCSVLTLQRAEVRQVLDTVRSLVSPTRSRRSASAVGDDRPVTRGAQVVDDKPVKVVLVGAGSGGPDDDTPSRHSPISGQPKHGDLESRRGDDEPGWTP
jgi:hypothetical protein